MRNIKNDRWVRWDLFCHFFLSLFDLYFISAFLSISFFFVIHPLGVRWRTSVNDIVNRLGIKMKLKVDSSTDGKKNNWKNFVYKWIFRLEMFFSLIVFSLFSLTLSSSGDVFNSDGIYLASRFFVYNNVTRSKMPTASGGGAVFILLFGTKVADAVQRVACSHFLHWVIHSPTRIYSPLTLPPSVSRWTEFLRYLLFSQSNIDIELGDKG